MSYVLSFCFWFINFRFYNRLTHQIPPACCVSLFQISTLANDSCFIQYSRKMSNCLLRNTISTFLTNCTLQKFLHLDELNTIKNNTMHIFIQHHPPKFCPFSILQYCQQHKVKHCILTTVAKSTNYEVTFFWMLGMKDRCVMFLNVKKSEQNNIRRCLLSEV